MQLEGSSAGGQGRKKKPKVDAYLQSVPDRKLKGQLKHTERLYKEANQVAAQVNTWLAPADAGYLETEGRGSAVCSAGGLPVDCTAACSALVSVSRRG